MSRPASQQAGGKRQALLLMLLLSVLFLIYAWYSVPRLTNNVMGDMDVTGWTGPIAERIVAGARPYVDFVLPVPPGGYLVLAAIQKAIGKPLLLEELWTVALCRLALGWIAYAIASALTTRRIAFLVAAGTLVVLTQLARECAYDELAQMCVWGSVACGAHALGSEARRRRWLWSAAGLFAGMAMSFKQTLGCGVLLGWVLAFGYFAWVARGSEPGVRVQERSDRRRWLAGAAVGLVLLVALVLLSGGTLGGFFQAVFADGVALKGGVLALLWLLLGYVFGNDVLPASLVLVTLTIAIGMRVARRTGDLGLADEATARSSGRAAGWIFAGVGVSLAFGTATGLVAAGVRGLPHVLVVSFGELGRIPAFGLALGCAFFVGQLWPRQQSAAAPHPGHHFNAVFLVGLVASMLGSLSFAEFQPLYDANVLLPLGFLFLFVACRRGRLGWLTAVLFSGVLLTLFSQRLVRALDARYPVGERGYWAGMRVGFRGREILHAAERVRSLTRPGDRVLVLPEDLELSALIGRGRPLLRGAVVFADLYPERLAAGDIQRLDSALPRVIVIVPRRRDLWQRLFHVWTRRNGARRVVTHVLDDVLPRRYRRVASYRSVYFWDQGLIDVYVRRDRERRP